MEAATAGNDGTMSIVDVPPGGCLPRATAPDEEVFVVVVGTAEVRVGGQRSHVGCGGVALVPRGAAREVRNAGVGPLRLMSVPRP
jgi:mannose-6-phosphate isomerase-like protein (cupin superfamily)